MPRRNAGGPKASPPKVVTICAMLPSDAGELYTHCTASYNNIYFVTGGVTVNMGITVGSRVRLTPREDLEIHIRSVDTGATQFAKRAEELELGAGTRTRGETGLRGVANRCCARRIVRTKLATWIVRWPARHFR